MVGNKNGLEEVLYPGPGALDPASHNKAVRVLKIPFLKNVPFGKARGDVPYPLEDERKRKEKKKSHSSRGMGSEY